MVEYALCLDLGTILARFLVSGFTNDIKARELFMNI
jgi:hypothetical protein